jgi:hypothetical protein
MKGTDMWVARGQGPGPAGADDGSSGASSGSNGPAGWSAVDHFSLDYVAPEADESQDVKLKGVQVGGRRGGAVLLDHLLGASEGHLVLGPLGADVRQRAMIANCWMVYTAAECS